MVLDFLVNCCINCQLKNTVGQAAEETWYSKSSLAGKFKLLVGVDSVPPNSSLRSDMAPGIQHLNHLYICLCVAVLDVLSQV